MIKLVQSFVHLQFYPKNVVQLWCRGRLKMTINIIFVLKIVTDAQGFECIKNMGVNGTKQRPSIHERQLTDIFQKLYSHTRKLLHKFRLLCHIAFTGNDNKNNRKFPNDILKMNLCQNCI